LLLLDQRLSAETARAEALRQSEERFRSLVQNSSILSAADSSIFYKSVHKTDFMNLRIGGKRRL